MLSTNNDKLIQANHLKEQNQIEEMAEDLHEELETENIPYHECYFMAQRLIKKGWIKPNEGSAVLSSEEYEKLKNLSNLIPKLSLENLKLKEEQKEMQRAIAKDNSINWLLKQDRRITEKRVSNETAEKIYKDLKLLVPDNALGILARYFKEIMDIKIKE